MDATTPATEGSTTVTDIAAKLHTQVAITAGDFGALMGLSRHQTSRAITDGRLGIATFQAVERGRHMVASHLALDYFAARGITL